VGAQTGESFTVAWSLCLIGKQTNLLGFHGATPVVQIRRGA
jgi:hypothetical protein